MTGDPNLLSQIAPSQGQNTTQASSKFLDAHNGNRSGMDKLDAQGRGTSDISADSSYSCPDSRASTPDPLEVYFGPKAHADRYWNEKLGNATAAKIAAAAEEDSYLLVGAAGRLPEDVYDRTLSWWRAGLRRMVLRNVEWESRALATMQSYVRHPFLDAYFVYTSSLGTHTFFMIMLPMFYFYGAPQAGRGLLLMLAAGVYVSSFIKDLCCVPRPFAPPVTRLTIGSHHLEYGFPSTHSTNSVSIALLLYTLLQRAYSPVAAAAQPVLHAAAINATTGIMDAVEDAGRLEGLISKTTYLFGVAVLIFYVFSIVYGRLYTAMHSFTDCMVGVALGAGIWSLHIFHGERVDAWVEHNGLIVPAIIVPLCLYLVHRHPQPVDDCPCFEDAIAFVSVVMGELLARWYMVHNGFDESFFVHPMPGSSWATWSDVFAWWSTAAIKMVIGVLTIFVWRIVAKSFCHFILPPTFRFLSHLFTLPHRRWYTPATDYTSVPPEKGLRPIPSVIDLPAMVEYEIDGVSVGASTARRGGNGNAIKQRAGNRVKQGTSSEKSLKEEGERGAQWFEPSGKNSEDVKHYDADVLTKVFVYCGIGVLASGVIPVMFEVLGWGVKTS